MITVNNIFKNQNNLKKANLNKYNNTNKKLSN